MPSCRLLVVSTLLLCLLGSTAVAQEAPDGGAARDAAAAIDGRTAGPAVPQPRSLAETLPSWVASIIGAVGSGVYLVALWVGLVGSKDGKVSPILAHFQRFSGVKVSLYMMSGGAVAMVFQLPEAKLVAIQAFIIGCTWPAVVANYLSGRQSGDGASTPVAGVAADLNAAGKIKDDLAQLPSSASGSTAGLDDLINQLSGPTTPPVPPRGGPTTPQGGP